MPDSSMRACGALLLFMGLGLEPGCNTGLVSIGDDRPLECEPDDCSGMPDEAPICADLSMGQHVCRGDLEQGCSWVLDCPALTCSASACGAYPSGAPMCFDGVWGSAWACDPSEMGCVWQGVCPEQARECPSEDCESPTEEAVNCMAGEMAGQSCLRTDTGECRWTWVVCAIVP
jgi:hypothetical protein